MRRARLLFCLSLMALTACGGGGRGVAAPKPLPTPDAVAGFAGGPQMMTLVSIRPTLEGEVQRSRIDNVPVDPAARTIDTNPGFADLAATRYKGTYVEGTEVGRGRDSATLLVHQAEGLKYMRSFLLDGASHGAVGVPTRNMPAAGRVTYRGQAHGQTVETQPGQMSMTSFQGRARMEVDLATRQGRFTVDQITTPAEPRDIVAFGGNIVVRGNAILQAGGRSGSVTLRDGRTLNARHDTQGAFYGPKAAEAGMGYLIEQDRGAQTQYVGGSLQVRRSTP